MNRLKIFLIVLWISFFCGQFNIALASNGMILYRNQDYNFSIEIPSYMQYGTPRGPNVKMVAGISGFNMNILIKSSPYLEFSDDKSLRELLNEHIKIYRNSNITLVEADVIDLPQFKVLYEGCRILYTYPERSFTMNGYMFHFIRHGNYYCIGYFVTPERAYLYQDIIVDSIGSFVDETSW